MTSPDLRGFTAAITADRRRDEQAVLLERLGIEVLMFPLLKTEPEDRDELRRATESAWKEAPDYFVANTGYGMRTWFELAGQWGLREALVDALRARTTIAVRGAKALGELRKVGLDAWYKAPGETLEEVVQRLVQEDLAGASVLVQLHGEPPGETLAQLRTAGANVSLLPVYRMGNAGSEAARALVNAVVEGFTDAVTFTAAPQVHAMTAAAHESGKHEKLCQAFNTGGVVAVCIGHVCAGAALSAGLAAPLVPPNPRLGSLTTALSALLTTRQLLLAGHDGPVTVSGRLIVNASGQKWLGPAQQRALRSLGACESWAPAAQLGAIEAHELSELEQILDGSLELDGGRCRLVRL